MTEPKPSEAHSTFSVFGPETEHVVKDPVEIDIQSMVGMNKEDETLLPVVMWSVKIGDQPFSIPIPPSLATAIGVQLIEAAVVAQTDVRTLEYDAKKGVPLRDSMDRLHTVGESRLRPSSQERIPHETSPD